MKLRESWTSESRSNLGRAVRVRDACYFRCADSADDVMTSVGISSRDKSRMLCRRACFEAGISSSSTFINEQSERFISCTSKPRNQHDQRTARTPLAPAESSSIHTPATAAARSLLYSAVERGCRNLGFYVFLQIK